MDYQDLANKAVFEIAQKLSFFLQPEPIVGLQLNLIQTERANLMHQLEPC